MIIPIGSCICLNFIQPFTENVNHCVNVFPGAFINIPVLYFPKYWSKKAFVKSLSGHELTLWNVVTTCHPNFQKKLFLHSSSWQPVLYITFPFEIWNDLDVHWLVHIFDVTLLECFNGFFFSLIKTNPDIFHIYKKGDILSLLCICSFSSSPPLSICTVITISRETRVIFYF